MLMDTQTHSVHGRREHFVYLTACLLILNGRLRSFQVRFGEVIMSYGSLTCERQRLCEIAHQYRLIQVSSYDNPLVPDVTLLSSIVFRFI